ncbi:MAG: hypothetical protein QW292_06790 [Candidatus Parvarchaeota archaeon]
MTTVNELKNSMPIVRVSGAAGMQRLSIYCGRKEHAVNRKPGFTSRNDVRNRLN